MKATFDDVWAAAHFERLSPTAICLDVESTLSAVGEKDLFNKSDRVAVVADASGYAKFLTQSAALRYFEPTTRYEQMVQGYVGRIHHMRLFTDAYKETDDQVFRNVAVPGLIYVYVMPEPFDE